MTKQHLLLNEVAALVNVKPYQISYAISVGLLPEPELRISNKRVFQTKDVQRILAHFKKEGAAMYEMFEFVLSTQLGEIFGKTRNCMGTAVADLGWRVRDGKKSCTRAPRPSSGNTARLRWMIMEFGSSFGTGKEASRLWRRRALSR